MHKVMGLESAYKDFRSVTSGLVSLTHLDPVDFGKWIPCDSYDSKALGTAT